MNKPEQTISNDVMQKIKQGEVQMKPRLYFTLLYVFAIFSVLAAGLVTAYLSSIVFYWIRIENSSTMAYGARRNLSEAIAAFPWWAVIIAIGLVAMAVMLVRRHGTMYRHRARTVTLVIIALSLIVGFIMYSAGIGELGKSRHGNPGGDRRGNGLRQNQ